MGFAAAPDGKLYVFGGYSGDLKGGLLDIPSPRKSSRLKGPFSLRITFQVLTVDV